MIPIDSSFPFCDGGALRYSVPSGSFSLINVGSGCYCSNAMVHSFEVSTFICQFFTAPEQMLDLRIIESDFFCC